MYLNAKTHPWKAAMFQVRDLDTGKIILHVRWADDTLGKYAQWCYDEFDEPFFNDDGDHMIELKNRNIKLEEKRNAWFKK